MNIIYIVEDDSLQADYIENLLRTECRFEVEIRRIVTESEFWNRFDEVAVAKPACIIMDILLQWSYAEVARETHAVGSYLTAGLRCQKKLAEDPRTKSITVVFHTVLDRSDIPNIPRNVLYLRKDASDSRFMGVIEEIMKRATLS